MGSRLKSILIIGGLVTLIVVVGLVWLISYFGVWPQVRDAFLVALALATFVALGLFSYAIFVMISLAVQVKKELTPVLDSLKDTTDTVRETAKVASELTITPGVKAASMLLGVTQIAGVFFGVGRARKRAEKRAQRRKAMAAKGELNAYR